MVLLVIKVTSIHEHEMVGISALKHIYHFTFIKPYSQFIKQNSYGSKILTENKLKPALQCFPTQLASFLALCY